MYFLFYGFSWFYIYTFYFLYGQFLARGQELSLQITRLETREDNNKNIPTQLHL